MIKHHAGALTMVEELFAQPGAGQDSEIFAFASDVDADQRMEIDAWAHGRNAQGASEMRSVATPSLYRVCPRAVADPRRQRARAPGYAVQRSACRAEARVPRRRRRGAQHGAGRDAAQARRLLRSQRAGWTPNRAGRRGERRTGEWKSVRGRDAAGSRGRARHTASATPAAPAAAAAGGGGGGLNFANSDLAFSGTHVFLGNFHGFNTYDVEDPRRPQLLASIVCPGGQGDVSVYGNLLFMSVEQTRGRIDCGTQGVAGPGQRRAVPRRAHLRHHRPQQAEAGRGGADLPRLAHAHAGHRPKDEPDNIYVYGSGTGGVRAGEELAGCSGLKPKRIRTRRSSAST